MFAGGLDWAARAGGRAQLGGSDKARSVEAGKMVFTLDPWLAQNLFRFVLQGERTQVQEDLQI
jgi:hypothetical protein